MDCHERGRPDLAYAFLNGYLDASGDYEGAKLLGYFAAYRSMVRAKVAALRFGQDHDEDSAERFAAHLHWAQAWLARPAGSIILMCGLSGAGKSHLAERLAPLLPAIRLRSDVARKTLAGLPALERTHSPTGGGLYDPAKSDAVFAYLAGLAEALLRGGENVIVDATFIEKDRRAEFLELAKRLGTHAQIIYCKAPVEVLRSRISKRSASGNDPSEATQAVLDMQLGNFSEPEAPEPVIEVKTDRLLSDTDLMALANDLQVFRGQLHLTQLALRTGSAATKFVPTVPARGAIHINPVVCPALLATMPRCLTVPFNRRYTPIQTAAREALVPSAVAGSSVDSCACLVSPTIEPAYACSGMRCRSTGIRRIRCRSKVPDLF